MLNTSTDAAAVIRSHEGILRPVEVAVMGSDFRDHLFVALDAPEGTNIVTIKPALSLTLLTGGIGSHQGKCDASSKHHENYLISSKPVFSPDTKL